TRGSQAVEGADRSIALAGAPTWGLTRVVASEHRGFDSLLVDLDPNRPAAEAAELVAEIETTAPDREVALRASSRFVNRVVQTSFEKLARRAAKNDHGIGYRLEIPAP